MRFGLLIGTCLFMTSILTGPAVAQNFASSGAGWSGSWGFGTANDRSVALSQAQTIRNAETAASPSSIVTYNTTNDNRTNYVDVSAENGAVTTDFQDGDNIGENTYAVGSLNTGRTTITLEGDDNIVEAVISADTVGCTDASIMTVTLDGLSGLPSSACD